MPFRNLFMECPSYIKMYCYLAQHVPKKSALVSIVDLLDINILVELP